MLMHRRPSGIHNPRRDLGAYSGPCNHHTVRQRSRIAISAVTVASLALLGAAPAWAVSASPSAISVDCDQANGVEDTTITGQIGDTFTVENTASTKACTLSSLTGIVTATGVSGNSLNPATTSTITIVGPGSFTITPTATGGLPGTLTVVIGNPTPSSEYVITFDGNGGNCSSNPLVVTAASNDWYEVPTEGTGPFQCYRDDYTLVGWSHGSTVFAPGRAEQVPDLPIALTPQAMAADHVTLYAEWTPLGVEITYDANVSAQHRCLTSSGANLAPDDRSSGPEIYSLSSEDRLAAKPPCSPVTPEGTPLVFGGWARTGDGPQQFLPREPLSETGLTMGTSVRLYAKWLPLPTPPALRYKVDDNFSFDLQSSNTEPTFRVSFQLANFGDGWMGLIFDEYMFPSDGIFVWYDAAARTCQVWDAYNPGIPTLPSFPSPLRDDDPTLIIEPRNPLDNVENVSIVECSRENGVTSVTVERKLETGDIFDKQLAVNDIIRVLAQYNDRQIFNNQFDAKQPMYTYQESLMIPVVSFS